MKRTHLAALILIASSVASAPAKKTTSPSTTAPPIFPLTSITAAVRPKICTPTRQTAKKSKKKT